MNSIPERDIFDELLHQVGEVIQVKPHLDWNAIETAVAPKLFKDQVQKGASK